MFGNNVFIDIRGTDSNRLLTIKNNDLRFRIVN